MKEIEEAIKLYKKMREIEKTPSEDAIEREEAARRELQAKIKEAEKRAKTTEELKRVLKLKALSVLDLGNEQHRRLILEVGKKLVELDPNDPIGWVIATEGYRVEACEGVKFAEKAYQRYPHPYFLHRILYLARWCPSINAKKMTKKILKELLKRYPKSAITHFEVCAAALLYKKKCKEVIAECKAAEAAGFEKELMEFASTPEDELIIERIALQFRMATYSALAECYVEKGMFREALAYVEKQRAESYTDAGPDCNAAMIFERLGEYKKAAEFHVKCASRSPSEITLIRALRFLLRVGVPSVAAILCDKRLGDFRDCGDVWCLCAKAYARVGRKSDAREAKAMARKLGVWCLF